MPEVSVAMLWRMVMLRARSLSRAPLSVSSALQGTGAQGEE